MRFNFLGRLLIVAALGSVMPAWADGPARAFDGFYGAAGGVRAVPAATGPLLPSLLLQVEVRRELKLTEDQTTQLGKLQAEVEAGPTTRRQQQEFRESMHGKAEAVLRSDQKPRFAEIVRQLQGVESLADATVVVALQLSLDQVDQLAKIAEALHRSRVAGIPRQDEARKKARERIMAVLTVQQRAAFEAMQGKPIGIDLENFVRFPHTRRRTASVGEGDPDATPEKVRLALQRLAGRYTADTAAPSKPIIKINLLRGGTTDADLAVVAEAADLQELELWNTAVTDAGLVHLRSLKGLRRLFIRSAYITDAGILELGGMPQLRGLSLCGPKFTDASLRHVEHWPNLTLLDLRESAITDASLKNLEHLSELERLLLGNTSINGSGLASLAKLTKLAELALFDTEVQDDNLVHLSPLTSLTTLKLFGTSVSDKGLIHLKNLHNLTSLSLAKTNVTDEGLSHLSGLAKLQYLDLSSTRIGDQGLTHLGELKQLKTLFLSDTLVTDAGLTQLKKLSSLKSLYLGQGVTTAGEQMLQESLPELTIKK